LTHRSRVEDKAFLISLWWLVKRPHLSIAQNQQMTKIVDLYGAIVIVKSEKEKIELLQKLRDESK
jgi:hypothetical protein